MRGSRASRRSLTRGCCLHNAPPEHGVLERADAAKATGSEAGDRKSTRLNSSHQIISYAVFCLKKKKSDIRREMMVAGRVEVGDLEAVGGYKQVEFPVDAKEVLEQHLVGTTCLVVDCVLVAHQR